MQSGGSRTCLACRKPWILSPAQHNQAWQLMTVIPGLWSCWQKGQSSSPLPVTSQIQDYRGRGREMNLVKKKRKREGRRIKEKKRRRREAERRRLGRLFPMSILCIITCFPPGQRLVSPYISYRLSSQCLCSPLYPETYSLVRQGNALCG